MPPECKTDLRLLIMIKLPQGLLRTLAICFACCSLVALLSYTGYQQQVLIPYEYSPGGRIGANCFDGSKSSATGRGACSHHGGVAEWVYSEIRYKVQADTFLSQHAYFFGATASLGTLYSVLFLFIRFSPTAPPVSPDEIKRRKKAADAAYWRKRNYRRKY